MKVVFLLAFLAFLALASSKPQFSVFNRQFFPNFSFGNRPVQRPVAFQRPVSAPIPATRFVQRPAPQPSRFVAQPSFGSSSFSSGNQVFREPVPVQNKTIEAPEEPIPQTSSNNCNPEVTNVEYNGKWYFVQWKNRFATKYTWTEAQASCSRIGMKMISMENPAKRDFFLNMLERDRYDYFWAGAKIRRGTLVWEDGSSEAISRGRYPWSDRGATGPQPEGNGDCLAILNNVYNDRVKYHDVACHHTKPTICECP